MANTPTFMLGYESVYNTSADKNVNVDVDPYDYLVVSAIGGDWESSVDNINTPSGGGLTYTLASSVTVSAFCQVYLWTAQSTTTQSFTVATTMNGGSSTWGVSVLRFAGVESAGAAASDRYTGAHAGSWLDLTTQDNNSVVIIANGDWNAADGSSRVWRTVNGFTPTSPGSSGEVTYYRNAATYGAYVGYYSDTGAIGGNTYGQSDPSGQKYSIVGVELIGISPLQPFHLPIGHRVTAKHQHANW